MKIAVLSDAHGNIYYLEKCLKEIEKIRDIEKKFFLGDAIGYGNNGVDCLEMLWKEKFYCLLGNHEAMLLGLTKLDENRDKVYRISLEKERVQQDTLNLLFSQRPFLEMDLAGKKTLFVHGNPFNPLEGYLYEDKLNIISAKLPYDIIFMGHTHRPYIKEHMGTQYVNVGSCGLPRDIGNMPSYVIYDTETDMVCVKRVVIEREYIIKNYYDVHPDVKKCMLR